MLPQSEQDKIPKRPDGSFVELGSKAPLACAYEFHTSELLDRSALETAAASITVRYNDEVVSCKQLDAPQLRESSFRTYCLIPENGTRITLASTVGTIPDPLGRVGHPLQFVFDDAIFRNIGPAGDPTYQAIIEPFANLGID